MEEADFGNIRNFETKTLQRETFSQTMICFLGYQILTAINYCHKNKIAHMDIKMENLVIDKFIMVKLIDFSISINYSNKNINEEINLERMGTKFYMPREILLSEKIKIKDLSKVDLYSFGVVLYILAFNKFPYNLTQDDGDNYDKILKKMNEEKLDLENDENYSNYFLDFLEKLLEKDINKRITLEEALNHFFIKGATILLDEKEKCYDLSSFLGYLLTDHIKPFNDYIKNEKSFH